MTVNITRRQSHPISLNRFFRKTPFSVINHSKKPVYVFIYYFGFQENTYICGRTRIVRNTHPVTASEKWEIRVPLIILCSKRKRAGIRSKSACLVDYLKLFTSWFCPAFRCIRWKMGLVFVQHTADHVRQSRPHRSGPAPVWPKAWRSVRRRDRFFLPAQQNGCYIKVRQDFKMEWF